MKFFSKWFKEHYNLFLKLHRWSIPEILLKKTYSMCRFLFVFQHHVFKDHWKRFILSVLGTNSMEIYSKLYTLVSLSSKQRQSAILGSSYLGLYKFIILGWDVLVSVRACLFLVMKKLAWRCVYSHNFLKDAYINISDICVCLVKRIPSLWHFILYF